MTANIELDLKSEYLLGTCSVATNLVTSLEFHPIRLVTMLCHFDETRQTRKGSEATYFNFLGNTVTSSAAAGYVVVPEHLSQNEEPSSRSEERTIYKVSFVPRKVNDRCSEVT